jgi:hypothetical protein
MQSTTSLLKDLRIAYPNYSFEEGNDFYWDHNTRTVFYSPSTSDLSWKAHLLHELAHAELDHHSYTRDIELLAKERDAWSYASSHLAPLYDLVIDSDIVKSAMDTYRDWMHARSTCPSCQAIGLEIRKNTYQCPACRDTWHVNEARICNLQRHRIKK